jgi:hypothetical protein
MTSRSGRLGRVLLLACAVAFFSGAKCSKSTPPPVGPTVTLVSVSVSGPGSVQARASAQLTATAQFSNSTSQAVTSDATWESSNTSVATVSKGLVSGVAAGASTIKATYQTLSGQVQMTVTVVLDANPGGPYGPIEAGRSLQLSGLSSTASLGIKEYRWDFGDGTTGNGATPTHTYATALLARGSQRTFTVTLTVVDNANTVSAPRTTTALVTRLY